MGPSPSPSPSHFKDPMDDREPTSESEETDSEAAQVKEIEAEEIEVEATEGPAPPAPPPIADGEEHAVDPRSVHVVRLIAVPLTLAIPLLPVVALTLVWALAGLPTAGYLPLLAALLLLAGLGVFIAYRFPAVRHRYLRYRVDPDGLRIQRGVFWRKTIYISVTRVQHTDVSQGPLQRRYSLAALTVHTAGTESASISLSGLEYDVATRLSEHLRPRRARDAG